MPGTKRFSNFQKLAADFTGDMIENTTFRADNEYVASDSPEEVGNSIYQPHLGEREPILSDSFKGGGVVTARPCRAQDANEISEGDK
jgi:hypothetical protein